MSGESKHWKELGEIICEGYIAGINKVNKESVANNYLKMHKKPMKRKLYPKDDRNKVRKNCIILKRFFENERKAVLNEVRD